MNPQELQGKKNTKSNRRKISISSISICLSICENIDAY